MTKIVMMPRELLHPHPDNPRKDLGDLEELRESIREHGVMQNLTIIPDDEDGYTILIGHRRFAASEGILDELPCVVVKGLSDKEQVGIMLCENMQRSDLTYVEQAHGFQMMMNLGDTIETISQKTGFSKTTIKHRLAINELDNVALAEAQEYFQPTISDFIELEKVKDIERRNQILKDAMNSRDIKLDVEEYLDDVAAEEDFEYYKTRFEAAGWTWEKNDTWFYYREGFKEAKNKLGTLRLGNGEALIPTEELKTLMAEIKGDIHFGFNGTYLRVSTYKEPKKSKEAEDKKRAEEEARRKKNRKALKEMRAEICDAYMDFIQNSQVELKDPNKELYFFHALLDLCREGVAVTLYPLTNEKIQYQLMDKLSLKGYDKVETGHFDDFESWTPLFQLLANIWWTLASSYQSFEDYSCLPNEDTIIMHRQFSNILNEIDGFHVKDEWMKVFCGTSDLFNKRP